MFAYVSLIRFYSTVAEGAVVLDRVGARRVVRCVPVEAEQRGCRVGMNEGEARTLCPDLRYVDYVPENYEVSQEAWLRSAMQVSMRISARTPHEAILDLRGHPDPALVMTDWLGTLRRDLGWMARVGIATGQWVAEYASQRFDVRAFLLGLQPPMAYRDVSALLAGASVRELPLDTKIRERLNFLGFSRLEQVVEAPLSMLRAHFGKEAIAIQSLARGLDREAFRPSYPRASVGGQVRWAGGMNDREAIERAMDAVVEQLMQGLSREDAEARSISLSIELEDGSRRMQERTFSKPMRRALALRLALLQMFDGMQLQESVVGLDALLLGLEKGPQAQASFALMRGDAERADLADRAMRHVRSVFGPEAVLAAGEIEQPRRVRLLKVWKDALGWH